MSNQLKDALSPYLLQHADNPVNWFPWGQEALELAEQLDRPIFLSIGYAACHWCHVMAHESFEDESIAEFLNDHFISIKVDREERPDLDQIYMKAVMAMRGGQGGWPLSVFLTPKQEVFFGGTYWPPKSNAHMPGFDHVLRQVANAFRDRREQVQAQATQITEYLNDVTSPAPAELADESLLNDAFQELQQAFDSRHGGFGIAPKFPHPMDLQLLVRLERGYRESNQERAKQCRLMVEETLRTMSWGGIYDHLGGGFARYSVDREWLVPHFEKMLYDNALLVNSYLDAFLAWGNEEWKRVICHTIDFVLEEMTDSQGGFHSTLDADSEGEEGKFYVWTPSEVESVIGASDSEIVNDWFGVTTSGNFEHGQSILHQRMTLEAFCSERNLNIDETRERIESSTKALLAERNQRVYPGKDDKIIASWNGLMIDALARAGAVLSRTDYVEAACRAASFIAENLVDDQGKLLHAYRDGRISGFAYLDDYACLINALVSLYEATFDESWIEMADRLAQMVVSNFRDDKVGDFFFTDRDHESLITRPKDWQDGSVPSGNSMICTALLRLGACVGNREYTAIAQDVINANAANAKRAPLAAGQLLIAMDMVRIGLSEWVLVGSDSGELERLRQEARYSPENNHVLLSRLSTAEQQATALDAAFEGKLDSSLEESQLFVCQGFTCQHPVAGASKIREHLRLMSETTKPILESQEKSK